MRNAFAVPLFLGVLSFHNRVEAAFTDFSDYAAARTTFALDEVFHSRDISFKAVNILSVTNPVTIFQSVGPGGAFLNPGPGTEVLIPQGTQEVSLDYEDGAGLRIAINGMQPVHPGQDGTPYHAGFSFLNGTSLAGVDVTTTTVESNRSYEKGVLTLRGPLDSLVIAGLELSIDNVTVRIPEPSSAALLLLGLAGLKVARRRRRT